MEKQEKEVKWKLEMEIGNKNGSQKKKACQLLVRYILHGLMSSILCHYSCALNYLRMVIGLGL